MGDTFGIPQLQLSPHDAHCERGRVRGMGGADACVAGEKVDPLWLPCGRVACSGPSSQGRTRGLFRVTAAEGGGIPLAPNDLC